jgi:hypothetical protein
MGAPPRSNRLLSAAAILFVVAGALMLAGNGILQYSQSIVDPPDTYGSLGVFFVSIFFTGAGGLAVSVAFLLLFIWQPGLGWQIVFLLAALTAFAGPASFFIPDGSLAFVGALVSLIEVGAGIVVVSRRIFGLIPSLIFLVTMIAPQLPRLVIVLVPTLNPLGSTYLDFNYLTGALYLACGIGMLFGVRARSTTRALWPTAKLPSPQPLPPQRPLPPWSSE